MVDIIDIYKFLIISTVTVTKNPKILKVVSDNLKTNNKNQTIFIQKCFNALRPKYVPGGQNVSIPSCRIILRSVIVIWVLIKSKLDQVHKFL